MHYTVIALPIILPVLFWAFYHYYKDRHQPEPVGYLLLAFLLGVGSYYLGGFMYWSLGWAGVCFEGCYLVGTNTGAAFPLAARGRLVL